MCVALRASSVEIMGVEILGVEPMAASGRGYVLAHPAPNPTPHSCDRVVVRI